MQRLRSVGITMETKVKVEEITDKGVVASRDGAAEFFAGDSVVLAVGLMPRNELAQRLEGRVAECHSIGDCTEAQRIVHAIDDGYRIAREI